MMPFGSNLLPSGINQYFCFQDGRVYLKASGLEGIRKERPDKFLRLFLGVKIISLEFPFEISRYNLLSILENAILSPDTLKSLSNYHFIKLICIYPEYLEGREEDFREKIAAFEEELLTCGKDSNMKRRGLNFANWIHDSTDLQKFLPRKVYQDLVASNQVCVRVNRLRTAARIPGLRSALLGRSISKDPLIIPEKFLHFIILFTEVPAAYPDFGTLQDQEILELFILSNELQIPELSSVCLREIKQRATSDNIMLILQTALESNNRKLLLVCLNFFNKLFDNENLFYSDLVTGLNLELADFKIDGVRNLIDFFSNHIEYMILKNIDVVRALLLRKKIFPNVNTLNLDFQLGACSENLMPSLREIFPNVVELKISKTILEQFQPKDLKDWQGLKVLFLRGPEGEIPVIKEHFPSVGICYFTSWENFKIEKKDNTNFIHLGDLPRECLDLSKHALIVTDSILLELCRTYTNIKRIILNECNKITDFGLKIIGEILEPEVVFLDRCTQLTEKGIKSLKHFSRLKNLSISGCTELKFTPKVTELLSDEMQSLDLSFNPHIKDKVVSEIAKRFKKLGYLDLRGCQISEFTLREARASLPSCDINYSQKHSIDEIPDPEVQVSKKAKTPLRIKGF